MVAITHNKFLVPEPFLLNCWKHHLVYIKYRLENIILKGKGDAQDLKSQLVVLGESQMDLYTGTLSPLEITNQVKDILVGHNYFEKLLYESWINTPPKGYKIISLQDSSEWTLRMGKNKNYIHLHPSRYSKNTIRIKANTLKTILAVQWMMQVNHLPIALEILNSARKKFFKAAPVKSLAAIKGIEKQMNILFPE
jgi:hypothetical protein